MEMTKGEHRRDGEALEREGRMRRGKKEDRVIIRKKSDRSLTLGLRINRDRKEKEAREGTKAAKELKGRKENEWPCGLGS